MQFLVFSTGIPGLALLFLAKKIYGFRLLAGFSSIFSAAYIYGIFESSTFTETLGIFGFALWLGSNVILAVSIFFEFAGKLNSTRNLSIILLILSLISNGIFAFWFFRTAGLGIV